MIEAIADNIIDSIIPKIKDLKVEEGEKVLLTVAEECLILSMSRMKEEGVEKIIDLIGKVVKWRLKEIREMA